MATGEETEIDFENDLSQVLHDMNVNEIANAFSSELGADALNTLINFKG